MILVDTRDWTMNIVLRRIRLHLLSRRNFVVGYSHAMASTGREPATIRIVAYRGARSAKHCASGEDNGTNKLELKDTCTLLYLLTPVY